MNIIAAQIAASTCPRWCAGHVPADQGVLHISPDHVVAGQAYVSLEQRGSSPAVRVELTGDGLLSPAAAVQLAAVLTASAFTAVTR